MTNLYEYLNSKLKPINKEEFYFDNLKDYINFKLCKYFYNQFHDNKYKFIYKREKKQFYSTINIINFLENNILRFTFFSFLERFSNVYILNNNNENNVPNSKINKNNFFKKFFKGNFLNFFHLSWIHTLSNNFSKLDSKLSYLGYVLLFETVFYPLEYFKTINMNNNNINFLENIKNINFNNMANGFFSRFLFSIFFTSGLISSHSYNNLYYLSFPLYFICGPLLVLKNEMQFGNSLKKSIEKIYNLKKIIFFRTIIPFILLNTFLPLKIKKLFDSDHKKNELWKIKKLKIKNKNNN